MKRIPVFLIAFPALLAISWYLTSWLFGFGGEPILLVLRAGILAGSLWLVGAILVWAAWRSSAWFWPVVGLLTLASLALIPPIFHEHEPNPPWLLENNDLLASILSQLLPCLALLVAALLLYAGLRQLPSLGQTGPGLTGKASVEGKPSGWVAVMDFALSILVLAGGLYHLYWLFVWDSTYDSLHVLLLVLPLLVTLFSAALLAELLAGRKKMIALLYALLIPALLLGDFYTAKQVDFHELTQSRAQRISRALEKYHTRYGSYPDRLEKLVPATMLSIPEPVIMYGQDWCYQAGQDSYRLGFVDRQDWSSPELFSQVSSSQGRSTEAGDLCKAEIKILKTRYPRFYGLSR